MRTKLEFFFTLLILAGFSIAVVMAGNWPMRTSLFPLMIGGIGISMAFAQVIIYLRKERKETKARPADQPAAADSIRRRLVVFGWVLGFFASTVLFGFQWGLPGIIFLYLKLDGREKLLLSIFLAALSWAILYGLKNFLHLPLHEGFL